MTNVLITGANRGIGLELTKAYLQDSHQVYATCRNYMRAEELQSLKSDYGDRLVISEIDVARPETFVNAEIPVGSTIDVLINNAGLLINAEAELGDVSPEDVAQMFNVNVLGPLRTIQKFLPNLSRSTKPVIASITSRMGSIDDNTGGGYYGYRISKTALNMLNKNLSIELRNAICVVLHPGWVQTDMGGSQAPVTPPASAAGLKTVISKLQKSDSGKFYDFQGQSIPW